MKKLRSDKTIMVLTATALIIAFIGIIFRNDQTKMLNGNATDTFFGPLIYIISYGLLRKFYLKKYKMEPTYQRYSWYDSEDGRKQNWMDVVVHIAPMMLGFLIPLIVGSLIK